MNAADSLQHVSLTTFSREECRNRYNTQKVKISSQSQLCVGGQQGRDSCSGDSGSVLMTLDTLPNNTINTWRLIGIVSFGPKTCGSKNWAGVYANVRFYIDWILDNVEL